MDGDRPLIWKMKSGDEEAMERFVRKYYPAIWQYCRHHVSDRGYAEDLAQETFERFFRALGSYRHSGRALPYLYTIAGNLCRNFYEKKQETAVDFSEEGPGRLPEDGLEEDVCGRLDMEHALAELEEELREVVILYYFQELKQKEIAEALQIGLPLVKYRLRRAKEELCRILKEEGV